MPSQVQQDKESGIDLKSIRKEGALLAKNGKIEVVA